MNRDQWHKHKYVDKHHVDSAIAFYSHRLGANGLDDYSKLCSAMEESARADSGASTLASMILTYRLKKTPGLFDLFMSLSERNMHEASLLLDSCTDADFLGYLTLIESTGYPKVEIFDVWQKSSDQSISTYNNEALFSRTEAIVLKQASYDESHAIRSVFITSLCLLMISHGSSKIVAIAEKLRRESVKVSVLTLIQIAENWEEVKNQPIIWSSVLYNQDSSCCRYVETDWYGSF